MYPLIIHNLQHHRHHYQHQPAHRQHHQHHHQPHHHQVDYASGKQCKKIPHKKCKYVQVNLSILFTDIRRRKKYLDIWRWNCKIYYMMICIVFANICTPEKNTRVCKYMHISLQNTICRYLYHMYLTVCKTYLKRSQWNRYICTKWKYVELNMFICK